MSCGDQARLPGGGNIQAKTRDGRARGWEPKGQGWDWGSYGVCRSPGAPHLELASGAPRPLTIRFTMMILGPSVLLMVKMCIRRKQNMMKSRERTMRPGYSSEGMSLAGQKQGLSRPPPGPGPGLLLTCPSPGATPGPQSTKAGCELRGSASRRV